MAPAAAAPESQFKKDEKALCFHHELLYEAKVLDLRQEGNDKKAGFEYKVHYKGWKNTWDDWVPEDRLRKLTPENRELANTLRHEMLAAQRAARAQPPPSKRKAQGSTRGSEERQTSVAAATGPRGQKRVRDHDLEKEEAFQSRRAIRVPMPDRLKSLLVDDWENITKNLQLANVPSPKPAGQILDEYLESQIGSRRRGSVEADILEEVIQGLKEYFNKSLGRLLLYRFEREQFFQIHTRTETATDDLAGKNFCDIYGGEHLLRLLVSMPELVAQTNMDQQSVGRLREELNQMLAWFSKEPQVTDFFGSTYDSPGQAYIDKVKSSA